MGIWRSRLATSLLAAILIVSISAALRAAEKATNGSGVHVRPAIYTRLIDARPTPSPMKLIDTASTKPAAVTTVGWRHRAAWYGGYGPACGPYGCWAGYYGPRTAYYRSFYAPYGYGAYWPSYGGPSYGGFYGAGYSPFSSSAAYYSVAYAPVYPRPFHAGYRGRYPIGWGGCCYW